MPRPLAEPATRLEDVDWEAFDFVDLGCSSGRSVPYCIQRFGGRRGLGVDLDPAKVARAAEAGVDVVLADATDLRLEKAVRFVSMLDFLEHLPDLDTVERVVASASRAATDFLFIKHPSFEGKEQAEALGVRQYWWHWRGHTCHIRVADYCEMFDRLGLHQYMIRYLGRVTGSHHESVIPVDSPIDTTGQQARSIVDKPAVDLRPALWRRQDIFVALRPFSAEEWSEITAPMPADRKLMSA